MHIPLDTNCDFTKTTINNVNDIFKSNIGYVMDQTKYPQQELSMNIVNDINTHFIGFEKDEKEYVCLIHKPSNTIRTMDLNTNTLVNNIDLSGIQFSILDPFSARKYFS